MLTEFIYGIVIISILWILVYLRRRSPLKTPKNPHETPLNTSKIQYESPLNTSEIQYESPLNASEIQYERALQNPHGTPFKTSKKKNESSRDNSPFQITKSESNKPNVNANHFRPSDEQSNKAHPYPHLRPNQDKLHLITADKSSANPRGFSVTNDKTRGKWPNFANFPVRNVFHKDANPKAKTEVLIRGERKRTTDEIFIRKIFMQSKLHEQIESQKVHKLNLKNVSTNVRSRVRKYEFGESTMGPFVLKEKVILLVGATGSGKTTLINSMINYVFGVEYEDEFRFKLVTQDDEENQSQAYSQTSWITAYTIHHQKGFKVDYTLTIVDTPGFGDTRGIDRDTEITKQIHQFFTAKGKHGIDHIDVVGFVAQSSLPRLDHTQKYIFDNILSLFGKDIGENIYLMLTFADGKVPQVLTGIQEAHLPYQEYFKFNNSVVFGDFSPEDEISRMFWKMGMDSFSTFFNRFSKIFTKSLCQSKMVIKERERIEIQIEALQTQMKHGISKLEQLKTEAEVVIRYEEAIVRNKDFTYVVQEDVIVKRRCEPNTYVTNCLSCNFTCHLSCAYSNDGEKYKCSAIDGGSIEHARCKVCPKKCHWRHHKNMEYYFTTERVSVTKNSQYLKRRHQAANGRIKSAKQIVKDVENEYADVQANIVAITNDLSNSINKLNELALKPSSLSTSEYLHILIESEKSSAKPGWQERVLHLTNVKEKVDNPCKIFEWDVDMFEKVKEPNEVGEYLGISMTFLD